MKAKARPRNRNSAGFSLAEVLVAISIFSISALGIQALQLGLTDTVNRNSHYASAMEIAQGEIEDLRSIPYSQVDSRTKTETVGGMEYAIASIVTEGVPQAETKHIATTVSWIGRGGVSRAVSLETLYAEIRV